MLPNTVNNERSFVVLNLDYYFLMLRSMSAGVRVNKKDKWPRWEWVVHNLIEATELAPRRTAWGLIIGLLFLMHLMFTRKEIKKNVKRLLIFHYGIGLSELLTGKEDSLWLEHNVQPCKLICPNDIRWHLKPKSAPIQSLCGQNPQVQGKDMLGLGEVVMRSNSRETPLFLCFVSSFSFLAERFWI